MTDTMWVRTGSERDALVEHPARIDDDGLVRVGNRWVAVAPSEQRLIELLMASFGRVVTIEEMTTVIPAGRSVEDGLYRRVTSLRRRLQPLGLSIASVRGRGYLLHSLS